MSSSYGRREGSRLTPSRAFSLVELLVVVAIIAILAAVLIPVINNAREAALTTKCLANLSAIGKAHVAYTTKYEGQIVPSEFGVLNASNVREMRENWATIFVAEGFITAPSVGPTEQPKLGDSVLACPRGLIDQVPTWDSGTPTRGTSGSWGSVTGDAAVNAIDERQARPWRYWGWTIDRCVDTYYGISSQTTNRDYATSRIPRDGGERNQFNRITDFRRPSTVAFIYDGLSVLGSSNQVRARVHGRHGRNTSVQKAITNVLFLDGHAETVQRSLLPYDGGAFPFDLNASRSAAQNLPSGAPRWRKQDS